MLSVDACKRPRMSEVLKDDWVADVPCADVLKTEPCSPAEVECRTLKRRGTEDRPLQPDPVSSTGSAASQSTLASDQEDDIPHTPFKKMRHIGWAAPHKSRETVMKTLKHVFQKLEIPLGLDSGVDESPKSVGYVGSDETLQISVFTDSDGIPQVEWNRMGASIFELKRVYQAVQRELDHIDGSGSWAHRYGADALDEFES